MTENIEDTLAVQLGIDREQFLEVFGVGWSELEMPRDRWDMDPVPSKPWYVAGSPLQLMLQIDGIQAVVARPGGRWQGVHTLVYEAADTMEISGDAADKPVVAALLRARRATFRYCALCHGQKPPEWMIDDTCMACASDWLGLVY